MVWTENSHNINTWCKLRGAIDQIWIVSNRSPGAIFWSLICISTLALHVFLLLVPFASSQKRTPRSKDRMYAKERSHPDTPVAEKTPSVILKVIIFNLFSPSGCFVISHKFFANISDTKICTSADALLHHWPLQWIFFQPKFGFRLLCRFCPLLFRGNFWSFKRNKPPIKYYRPPFCSSFGIRKLLALSSVIYRFPFGITIGWLVGWLVCFRCK